MNDDGKDVVREMIHAQDMLHQEQKQQDAEKIFNAFPEDWATIERFLVYQQGVPSYHDEPILHLLDSQSSAEKLLDYFQSDRAACIALCGQLKERWNSPDVGLDPERDWRDEMSAILVGLADQTSKIVGAQIRLLAYRNFSFKPDD